MRQGSGVGLQGMPAHQVVHHRRALVKTLDTGALLGIDIFFPLVPHGIYCPDAASLNFSEIINTVVGSDFTQEAGPQVRLSVHQQRIAPRCPVAIEQLLLSSEGSLAAEA